MFENDSRPLGKIIATLCQSSGGRDFGKVARKIAYRSRILLNSDHKRSVIPRVGPSLIFARSALQFLRRATSSLPLYVTSLSQGSDKESLSKKENGRLYGDGQCRGVRPRDTGLSSEENANTEWGRMVAKRGEVSRPYCGCTDDGDMETVRQPRSTRISRHKNAPPPGGSEKSRLGVLR